MQLPVIDLLWENANDSEGVGCYFIPTSSNISNNAPKEHVYFHNELEVQSIKTFIAQIEKTFNLKRFGHLKKIERLGGFRFALHFASHEFLNSRDADKYSIKWSVGDRKILLSFDEDDPFPDISENVLCPNEFYGHTLISAEDKKHVGDILQSIGYFSEMVYQIKELSLKNADLNDKVRVYERDRDKRIFE